MIRIEKFHQFQIENMYQYIKYLNQDGLATITLNRPEVYNALNNGIKLELQDAFKNIEEDKTVRVVVLTGEGKAFSSGQDLKVVQSEMKGKKYSEVIRTYYNPLIISMHNLEKPIICRLNGIAAGAGCSLALACDLIIASEEASLSELFVGIGLIMDSGSTYFLPRMVGSQKAFELATMGTKISAKEAYNIGLINRVIPIGQLDETVEQYVDYYLNGPTVAIGLIKRLLNQSVQRPLEEVLEFEAQWQDIAAATRDHQEGVEAFLEKRKPRFQGK